MTFKACLLVVLALGQEGPGDLDSPDAAVARPAIESAIRAGDEKALEVAAKSSRGARLALAEVRAHKRFGEAYPLPLSITYEAKDQPTGEVLSAISKLLGTRIEEQKQEGMPGRRKETLSIALKEATYLETVDALAASLGASISVEEDALRYSNWPSFPPEPQFYWRHFKISVGSFSESREVFPQGDSKGRASLYFTVWTDGRCRVVGSRGIRLVEVVENDGGREGIAVGPAWNMFGPWHRYQQFGMHVALNPPGPKAAKLGTVRGVQRFLFPEDPKFSELPLADRTRAIEGENYSLRIEEASPDGSTVKIVATFNDWKKAHVLPLPADFQLAGKDGRLVAAQGSVSGPAESATLQLKFTLPKKFEAAALKVRVFGSIGEQEFPFEFKDLPLR